VLGNAGTVALVRAKSNAAVRSPHTPRRHGEMLGSWTPNRCSMNRTIDVWSNTWEHTQPPVLHGDTTSIGTRWPRPYGPGTWFSPGAGWNSSPAMSTVDEPCAGDGGG
jgi:hypothetical protein